MITFTQTAFIIKVECGGNPIENWLNTHSELIDALQCETEDMHQKRYHYLELLREMMPDVAQAKKMIDKVK